MPPAEVQMPITKPSSYAAAVRDLIPGHRLDSQPHISSDVHFQGLPAKSPRRFRGIPAVSFTANEIQVLSSIFRYALVGAFPQKRPPLSSIRKAMEAIGFSKPYSVGHLQSHQILFNFRSDLDFQRFWLKNNWYFFGCAMNVSRWTPSYYVEADSPLCPVWVAMEGIPVHLHDVRALYVIAGLLGRPLKIDAPTANFSRPSTARILIELDISRELSQKIWIDNGESGFFQAAVYENLPVFCTVCSRFGHTSRNCSRVSKPMMQKAKVSGTKDLITDVPNMLVSVPLVVDATNLVVGVTSCDTMIPNRKAGDSLVSPVTEKSPPI
ncbi:unnamed protein product [Cuscuta europaea]|uniref:DUF4283 domain-containing protein n=1 Tax=Cuscuta europaea TaxID=41803 RepID=A0A9P0YJJ1_CUSEU|nr:unnamed protein product [Cuscuta europaea]